MSRVAHALGAITAALSAAPDPLVAHDWAAALQLANKHLLAPAIYSALLAYGRLAELPDDAREYLQMLHRLNGERNQVLRRQAIELIGALNRVGIQPMLLKGGLLLFRPLYTDPAARMIRDLDVLVPAALRPRAVEVLHDLGYGIATKYEAGHNAYGDFTRPNDPGAVDLHVEIIEMPHLLSAEEVWRRGWPVTVSGVQFQAPSWTDSALHHLLHAQIHYLGNFYRGILDLRQVHEFSLLVRDASAVDWRFIAARFARHHLSTVLESYMLVTQKLFGAPWKLPGRASLAARAHSRRCLFQLRHPWMEELLLPYGNIRGAFAWHRMNHISRGRGSIMMARLAHAVQFLRKEAAWGAVIRALRTE